MAFYGQLVFYWLINPSNSFYSYLLSLISFEILSYITIRKRLLVPIINNTFRRREFFACTLSMLLLAQKTVAKYTKYVFWLLFDQLLCFRLILRLKYFLFLFLYSDLYNNAWNKLPGNVAINLINRLFMTMIDV